MRDVAERTGVHQRRLPFERLHDVGLDRVLHHDRHRARDLQHLRGDRLAVISIGDDNAAETTPQIGKAARQREDRHHLRSSGDDELTLTREPVGLAAQADDRIAELAIVHVEGARPDHRRRIDAQRVAVVDRGVERRGEQIVRGRHGVEVTVEMEVDVLHRTDL